VAFVGPSGAGKTTLLRLLNGTVRPSAGTVAVDGRPLAALPPAELRRLRARIGFVHQDFGLVPNLRVLHNVLAGRLGAQSFLGSLRCFLVPPRRAVVEVHALLERVGIPEKLYEPARRLSGGQRQRVAVARALFQRPGALLADEPVSSVDPARARDTVGLLVEVCRERGLTLVVSLHDLGLAREFFPRLVGVRRGRIAFDRASAAMAEEEFAALYDLAPEELLCS
jgi:phosphonate transport system ATP-binding protein